MRFPSYDNEGTVERQRNFHLSCPSSNGRVIEPPHSCSLFGNDVFIRIWTESKLAKSLLYSLPAAYPEMASLRENCVKSVEMPPLILFIDHSSRLCSYRIPKYCLSPGCDAGLAVCIEILFRVIDISHYGMGLRHFRLRPIGFCFDACYRRDEADCVRHYTIKVLACGSG